MGPMAPRGTIAWSPRAIALAILIALVPNCANRQSGSTSAHATPDPLPEFHPHPEIAPEEISTQDSHGQSPDAGIQDVIATSVACSHLGTPPPAPISHPRIRSGPPITNRIPPEVVMRPIRTRAACLRACYQRALAAKPTLQGRVSLRLVIDEDGWLRRTSVWKSDLGDSAVPECLARELVGLQFPQPEGGKVTVIYPLELSPEWVDAGASSPSATAPPKLSAHLQPGLSAVSSAATVAQPGLPGPSFYVTNETPYKVSLLRLGSAIVASSGPIFSKLSDAGIEQDELFGKGLPANLLVPVTALAGSFPDAMWATVIQTDGSSGWGELYRNGKQGWSRVGRALPQTVIHIGIGNWNNGRVLALQGSPMGMVVPFAFRLISGSAVPVPILTKASVLPEGNTDEHCKHWQTLLVPEALAVLTSGDVFVVGKICSQSAYGVEHWAPGQTRSQVYVFPESSEWWDVKLLARSERDLVMFANSRKESRLAHFDGAAWTTEPLGIEGTVTAAELAIDGTLFAVSHVFRPSPNGAPPQDLPGRLFWRPVGQVKFSELAVPSRKMPELWPPTFAGVTAVAAFSKDDVWVVSGDLLLHSRPAAGGPRKFE